MLVQDARAAVLRALAAYKVEIGMSQEDAAAWSEANLDEGTQLWLDAIVADTGGEIESIDHAYEVLRSWAQPDGRPANLIPQQE